MAGVSDYEKLRQQNIADNKRILAELGLLNPVGSDDFYNNVIINLVVMLFLFTLDRVFCPKICLFKTDGWHFGTEFLATQKTSISENYCHFKL